MNPIVLLAAYALLFAGSVWAITTRVRPALIVFCLLAAALFAWFARDSWLSYRWCERILSTHRRYEIDATGNGDRVLRIDALPDVRGICVVAVRKDGGSPDYDSLRSCQWRARDSAGKLDTLGDSRALLNTDSDERFGEGNRTWTELTYRLDENTRPVLQSIQLEARASLWTLKGCNVYRDVDFYSAIAYGVGSLLSIVGFVSQIIRFVRRPGQPAAVPPA
ncbi:MAG TPA: hypothetical protein VGK61_06200 [Planctomycetota bacterium]